MPKRLSNEISIHSFIRQLFYPQVPGATVNKLRTKCDMEMITGEETTGTLSLQSEHLGAGKDYITLLLVGSKVA